MKEKKNDLVMQKKLALELIEFALGYNVDYILVLEELEKILKGESKSKDFKSFLDY